MCDRAVRESYSSSSPSSLFHCASRRFAVVDQLSARVQCRQARIRKVKSQQLQVLQFVGRGLLWSVRSPVRELHRDCSSL